MIQNRNLTGRHYLDIFRFLFDRSALSLFVVVHLGRQQPSTTQGDQKERRIIRRRAQVHTLARKLN